MSRDDALQLGRRSSLRSRSRSALVRHTTTTTNRNPGARPGSSSRIRAPAFASQSAASAQIPAAPDEARIDQLIEESTIPQRPRCPRQLGADPSSESPGRCCPTVDRHQSESMSQGDAQVKLWDESLSGEVFAKTRNHEQPVSHRKVCGSTAASRRPPPLICFIGEKQGNAFLANSGENRL